MESVHSEGHNPPDIKNPNGEPQAHEKFRIPEIYFVHRTRRRKFAVLNGKIILSTPSKIAQILPENCFCGMAVSN